MRLSIDGPRTNVRGGLCPRVHVSFDDGPLSLDIAEAAAMHWLMRRDARKVFKFGV